VANGEASPGADVAAVLSHRQRRTVVEIEEASSAMRVLQPPAARTHQQQLLRLLGQSQ
jgi:hypothetical protein